jgi:hypothetical protein
MELLPSKKVSIQMHSDELVREDLADSRDSEVDLVEDQEMLEISSNPYSEEHSVQVEEVEIHSVVVDNEPGMSGEMISKRQSLYRFWKLQLEHHEKLPSLQWLIVNHVLVPV